MTAQVACSGSFDLDHPRPKICQLERGKRPGEKLAEVNNEEAIKRALVLCYHLHHRLSSYAA
jgi:hypothetical protein